MLLAVGHSLELENGAVGQLKHPEGGSPRGTPRGEWQDHEDPCRSEPRAETSDRNLHRPYGTFTSGPPISSKRKSCFARSGSSSYVCWGIPIGGYLVLSQ